MSCSKPEKISHSQKKTGKFANITGVILAGGASSRMGRNKALLTVDGIALIEKIFRTMAGLFTNVLMVTNTPQEYDFLPCPKVGDIYPGVGSIAGLHSGLVASCTPRIFVVACDAPFLSADLIRMLCSIEGDYAAVIPVGIRGKEPLHALYGKECLPSLEQMLEQDQRKILYLYDQVPTRYVMSEEFANIPEAELSFYNLNTPEEYLALRPPKLFWVDHGLSAGHF